MNNKIPRYFSDYDDNLDIWLVWDSVKEMAVGSYCDEEEANQEVARLNAAQCDGNN